MAKATDVTKVRSLRDAHNSLVKNIDLLQDAIHNLSKEAVGDSELYQTDDSEDGKNASSGSINDVIASHDALASRIEAMVAHVNNIARHLG